MRCVQVWAKLEDMDTLISAWPLVVALVPLVMAIRALMTDRPTTMGSTPVPQESGIRSIELPSLATSKDLDDTTPIFLNRQDWWSEEQRNFYAADLSAHRGEKATSTSR
jgi:hypothetical protein